MDQIRQAVDRSRTAETVADGRVPDFQASAPASSAIPEIQLDQAFLESKRIISFDYKDARARTFDMLRTQLLRSMDANSWQFIGVTSPTEGCGKTVVATNLAISMARLTERSVLLVDMDMHQPKIAEYLGVETHQGLLSVINGSCALNKVVFQAVSGRQKFAVLPGEHCEAGASELLTSQAMATLLQSIKREFRSRIVIFDMPPVLVNDDVISIAPQMDCFVMVTAVGQTTVEELKECNKHLKSANVLRTVVNKVTEPITGYGYGYGYGYGQG